MSRGDMGGNVFFKADPVESNALWIHSIHFPIWLDLDRGRNLTIQHWQAINLPAEHSTRQGRESHWVWWELRMFPFPPFKMMSEVSFAFSDTVSLLNLNDYITPLCYHYADWLGSHHEEKSSKKSTRKGMLGLWTDLKNTASGSL